MTVQDIMIQAYQDAGEPSDLCPFTTPGDESTFDIATAGAVKLLRKLNAAQTRIVHWRFRNGRLLHLRSAQSRAFLKVQAAPHFTATFVSQTFLVITTLSTGWSDSGDQFKGWILSVESGTGAGQERMIVESQRLTLPQFTIDRDWDTALDGTSVLGFRKTFFPMVESNVIGTFEHTYCLRLDPENTLEDILKIRNTADGSEVERVTREELLLGDSFTIGEPSQYALFGNTLWFNAAPDEQMQFEVLYQGNPAELTLATESPHLPPQYHHAVTLWLTHDIMRMNHDFDGAYATKRELEDLMEMTRMPGESDFDYGINGVTVYG